MIHMITVTPLWNGRHAFMGTGKGRNYEGDYSHALLRKATDDRDKLSHPSYFGETETGMI